LYSGDKPEGMQKKKYQKQVGPVRLLPVNSADQGHTHGWNKHKRNGGADGKRKCCKKKKHQGRRQAIMREKSKKSKGVEEPLLKKRSA